MTWPQHMLPSFSAAKDPADFPFFQGKISRWIWRMYTHRLTPAGRWLAAITVIFISYGGASLQLQGYVLAGYAATFWAVALVANLFYRPRVKLAVSVPPRTSVGQTLPVEIEVEQRGWLSGADLVVVPDRLPMSIDSIPEDGVRLPDLPRSGHARARLMLKCNRRGKHLIRGFRVESEFPFGLLRAGRIFAKPQAILVYPEFRSLIRLELPSGRRFQPGGVALASKLGESFEYLGNREYRDGDNVRDIDWRATARLQRPIVREWVEEYMLRVAVILDTHLPKDTAPVRADDFERAVSIAAAVADHMARQDYLVDLFAAGPNLYHLTAGRSLAYLDQILDILACVEGNPEEPFEVIEPQIAELLARISTVICVFLDWNEARRQFVERLAQQGVGVKVIIVRDATCTEPPMDACVVDREMFTRGVDEL
jgi:uncharacterized protein (DUF58 family)